MLTLSELRIHGFRSFAEPIDIPVRDGMTVLTGENDGGKTATINALQALIKPQLLEQEDISKAGNIPVDIRGKFTNQTNGEELNIRVILKSGGQPSQQILRHSHSIFGCDPSIFPLPELKKLLAEAEIVSPGGSAKQPYVEAAQAWLAGRTEGEFNDAWVSLDSVTQAMLPRITLYTSTSSGDPIKHVNTLVATEIRRLLGEEGFKERLDSIQADLADKVSPSLNDFKEKILEYCDDLDDVEITVKPDFRSPATSVSLDIVQGNEQIPLNKSGEGKKRRITLAIHETENKFLSTGAVDRSEIIAYDEPDTHLDYTSQRTLFGILDEQSKISNVQVVVATHSLNFIDKVALNSIVHYQLDEGHHTTLEVLESEEFDHESDFLASVCSGLGLRNSTLLDERVFLMLEGETEFAAVPCLFKTLIERSLLSSGIVMFNSQGSGALRKIARTLKNEWDRQVVALLDEDQRLPSTAWITEMGLVEGDDLFFIGTKEFEDAFSDDQWAETLNASYPVQDDGAPWRPEDIFAIRREDKFSAAIASLASNRTRSSVRKPDLGLALGRNLIEGSELPQKLQDCMAAANQLTNA